MFFKKDLKIFFLYSKIIKIGMIKYGNNYNVS